MALIQGMNDIFCSGIYVKDINAAFFKYDVIYDEFSDDKPQLLVVDLRTGKLLFNTIFETKGFIKKEVEKILDEYSDEYYKMIADKHNDSKNNSLKNFLDKFKSE